MYTYMCHSVYVALFIVFNCYVLLFTTCLHITQLFDKCVLICEIRRKINKKCIMCVVCVLFVYHHFLGFSIRTKSAMNWHFPGIFWKQLIGE